MLNPLRYFILKISAIATIYRLYKNWPVVIFDRSFFRFLTPLLVYELRNSIRILVRTDDVDGRIADNTFRGEYAAPEYDIQSDYTVIDIGAHIGTFTLQAAAKAYKGKVYAFEPFSENFKLLQANILINRFTNITAGQFAVSDKKKQQKLFINQTSRSLASLATSNGQSETVNSVTLAEIFHKYHISQCNFLKLDCEGAEYNILMATPATVFKRIDLIVFECHLHDQQRKKLEKFLGVHNFSLIHTKNRSGHPDILFFKKSYATK